MNREPREPREKKRSSNMSTKSKPATQPYRPHLRCQVVVICHGSTQITSDFIMQSVKKLHGLAAASVNRLGLRHQWKFFGMRDAFQIQIHVQFRPEEMLAVEEFHMK